MSVELETQRMEDLESFAAHLRELNDQIEDASEEMDLDVVEIKTMKKALRILWDEAEKMENEAESIQHAMDNAGPYDTDPRV